MRKNFVFFVLVPAFLLFVTIYLFLDSWIESGLEYAGEKVVGAKVEIDNLRITINPIGIDFTRLQVADPNDGWTNLFETGKVQFALNFGQLLRGKYIVETMEMNNLIFGTKRSTDGSIPKPKEKLSDKTGKQISLTDSTGQFQQSLVEDAKPSLAPKDSKSAPSFDIEKLKRELNTDSLLNPNNLATYRRIDSLKSQINNASVQWQTTLDEFDKSKVKLSEIESRTKSINIGNIKDLKSANDALDNAKSILKDASDVKNSFNERKAVLTTGVNNFTDSFKELDDLVKEDFRNVLNMARLPDISMKGLAEMLLGKDILNKAYEYLGYVDMAKSKIQNTSSKPPIEKPKRFEGQNIHFPVERAYPKFWVKKIHVSGGTDQKQDPQYFYAKGEVLNITNDQRITGFPLTVDLSATKGGTTTLALGASFDRRKELAVDNYKAILTGLPINKMSLGNSDFLPARITNSIANASIIVEVPGNKFNSNTGINFTNMSLEFNREPKGIVERIVRDVLAPITGFKVNLRMWKSENKFDVAFETDLDDRLASRTKQVIGAEIEKIRRDIQNKLNAKIAEKRAEAENLYNEKREMVMSKVKEYENQVNEKLAMVETKKKEIEDRIEQEKKKQVDDATKKAKDAIKNIFKK